MSISVQHLSRNYGTNKAVDDISFNVEKGEIVGFLGPNGAGKSTTMKVLTCFLPPDTGQVLLDGFDVTTASLQVRRILGYLPEHNPLYLDMYVKEYLAFVGGFYKMRGKTLHSRIDEVIGLTGINLHATKKIGSLSKGYRQRVGLAQALVHDPEILVLDEPTTGLDPNQISEVRQLIKSISADKTVILSTHIMQEVEAICDRALIINKGKIVADNPVSELRRGRGQVQVRVETGSPVARELFEALPHVQRVEDHGINTWTITSDQDIRPDITRLITQQNIDLLNISLVERSLEEVFQELTNENG